MHDFLRALTCAMLASACGIDSAVEIQPLTAVEDPVIDPFLGCAWGSPLPSNQNIGVTGFGYTGDERGFRIHHGNYVDGASDYLEYKVEVIWTLPGCSGTVYYVRIPFHQIANHTEVQVRNAAQSLRGRITATEGSLPQLFNQANAALPTHKRGPFVITSAMVGAGGMSETVVFTLLDTLILSRLPPPVLYNGVAPTPNQATVMATAYADLYEENEYLYSFFRFRLDLGLMNAATRQVVADNIDLVKDEPGPVHGDLLWEEHHHVDHAAAVEPAAVGVGFGGFWNGHRNLNRVLETHLRRQTIVPGFGRVPSWDPATTIPAEFATGILVPREVPVQVAPPGNLSGGTDLEVAYRASNICASFDPALSPLLTHAQRMTDLEVDLWDDVRVWHDSLHGAVGGDFAFLSSSASVPLFYPWHTTVDVIWQNWQLCEPAYHPNRYSWDAL